MKRVIKHYVIIICIIIVSIVILGIKTTSISNEYGTYIAGDEKNETAVYYVFDKNGGFAFYSQFGEIHKGSYYIKEKFGEFSYIEANINDMIMQFYIHKGKQCIGFNNDLFIAKKISELPNYINVCDKN